MNRIYQIIWSRAKQGWVVVAETARIASLGSTSSRKALKLLALTLLLGMTAEVQALPQGGSVTGGSGTIAPTGNQMTITQNSPSLSINWQSFDIGAGESVKFQQPNAQALAFNQVTGSAAASQILGNLSANGQVWLVNPNGVLFGQNATVDVAGLLASTLNLQSTTGSTSRFAGNGMGSIINQGEIKTSQGGYVALIANQVSNQGSIQTPRGTTALVGGSDVTVTFPLVSPVSFQINASTLNNLAENAYSGRIEADGGVVIMSAGSANNLLQSTVNNEGLIQAETLRSLYGKPTASVNDIFLDRELQKDKGTIYFIADGRNGTINVDGALDISDASEVIYNGDIQITPGKIEGHHTAVLLSVFPGGKFSSRDVISLTEGNLFFYRNVEFVKDNFDWSSYLKFANCERYSLSCSVTLWFNDPASSLVTEYSPRSPLDQFYSGKLSPSMEAFEQVKGLGENMGGDIHTAHKIKSHKIR